jgi:hypothetical protein
MMLEGAGPLPDKYTSAVALHSEHWEEEEEEEEEEQYNDLCVFDSQHLNSCGIR